METKLIITDITRMSGSRVCLAAVTEDLKSIRPVLPFPGIQESFLHLGNNHFIRPFSILTLDLLYQKIDPPHTEDWQFTPRIISYYGELDQVQRRSLLERIIDPSVQSIFGTDINTSLGSAFILHGFGSRSLGTIRAKSIDRVEIMPFKDSLSFRFTFRDLTGFQYKLSCTDLSFRNYVLNKLLENGRNFSKTAWQIWKKLQNADIFLRIGLGRAWAPNGEQTRNRCYLFIVGIYSFPDYLEGKCFADFDTQAWESDYSGDYEIPF